MTTRHRTQAGIRALRLSHDDVDKIQMLSRKGLLRRSMCLELDINEQTLDSWARVNCEVRDALSVNDAIRAVRTRGSK